MQLDLDDTCELRAVQVNFADYKAGLFGSGTNVYTQIKLLASENGTNWLEIADLTRERRDRPNAYLELPRPVQARFIRYEHTYVGGEYLAISELRVFGKGPGNVPATPTKLNLRRDNDPRNAFLTWEDVPTAVGYNVLWGITPDKLYQTYQVFADQRSALEVRELTTGQEYWFAIEAFNENGVSGQSSIVHCP